MTGGGYVLIPGGETFAFDNNEKFKAEMLLIGRSESGCGKSFKQVGKVLLSAKWWMDILQEQTE